MRFPVKKRPIVKRPFPFFWEGKLSKSSISGLFSMLIKKHPVVIEVLLSTNNIVEPKHTSMQEALHSKTKIRKVERRQKVDQSSDVDCVPTNTHSHNKSQLYIFDYNEAVIKMIIEGRSPHDETCVQNEQSCSWLVVQQNQFGTKIQIKYVNTNNQLADILTKGSFSRDEWDNLLSFFNIMSFSMYSCSHFSNFLADDLHPIGKQNAMSKRSQKTTSNEGAPTAKEKSMSVKRGRERERRSEEISSQSLGSQVPMKEKKS